MTYIKFNDYQCELVSFNKYTNFENGEVIGNCNCSVISTDISGLQELGKKTINCIQILQDEVLIYDLNEIEAHLASISEVFTNGKMEISLMINF